MAKTKNTILHRRYEEVWNKGCAEHIDEMIAPDAVAHGLEDPEKIEPGPLNSLFLQNTDACVIIVEQVVDTKEINSRRAK